MTAEMAGKAAADGVWATLRQLREKWMLMAFFAGALVWARDVHDEFAPLPVLVHEQMQALAALDAAVTRLEGQVTRGFASDRSPVLGFPGTRHGIGDGAPGAWTLLSWRPVRRLRADCVAEAVEAWMVDAAGAWFAVEMALAPMPALEHEQDLAFGIRVHPAMTPGRALALVQVSFDCGTHRQVEAAPWLQFRVLAH
ncbi:MAG TPA: hypothetical protein VMM59_00460 [Thermohalobaculum sp.]|nr:hypothetical protein [Thermohalobaculum sp.]